MYDMYPDWGPAQRDPEHPWNQACAESASALQTALDRRDNGGPRPDDN